ncbi:calcium homeostasis modulator protein 1-like [Denticeps clupeoides]|uniref:Calcium homeostasis modulator 1 n=1 Tax=Denticeps clupeoides TaxID=299321 RepID=A0AAY4E1U2_9TELE|nr:calcium homeostasis modulator protein 1-like [Denticeps clupeoides]
MDKLRLLFQFLQANQESFMNGLCGIMALASAQLYTSFEFTCPCLPEYNYAYGIGILLVPPIWFFMLGFVLNNNVSMLTEEWKRPAGKRDKDPKVLRYMLCSITQRSLIAPAVWISVTLLDGKSFLCAFSARFDLHQFRNHSHEHLPDRELSRLLARIPCKDVFDGHDVIAREAASRYIRCISQACGWMFLMLITCLAFTARAIRPCFSQAIFLKTKYWSHYIDTERKIFDQMCKDHAKSFAKIGIQRYFHSISGEIFNGEKLNKKHKKDDDDDDGDKCDEEKLLGIHAEEDVNKVLWNWHTCKPALNLTRDSQTKSTHHKQTCKHLGC